MGRTATGTRGMRLEETNDEVIGMICLADKEASVLVVASKGYGKRSDIEEYRITNRGGKGVRTIKLTEKTGFLISIKDVVDGDDLMIINKSGITLRMAVADLRVMGRATQGVRLINLNSGDEIAAVAKVDKEAKSQDGGSSEDYVKPVETASEEVDNSPEIGGGDDTDDDSGADDSENGTDVDNNDDKQ